MTIDEAINKYIKLKIFAEGTDDKRAKEEYEQLVELLEELKANKVASAEVYEQGYKRGYKNGFNKAIDDFRSKLIMHFADWELSQAPCNDDETDSTREIICETIENAIGGVEEIAEQLKAGGDSEI